MKRLSTALVAIVVWLGGAASAAWAEPAGVASKEVTESRAAVTAYWTPARMRDAAPAAAAPTLAPGDPAAAPAEAAFSSGEYPGDSAAPPASAHGKVFFTSRGADYQCSGTAIASQNRSVVWTAGHCVNDGPGAFHANWTFVPAYRDGQRPLGTWTARSLLTTDAWRTSGSLAHDLGAAVVAANGTQALTDRTGGRGIAFGYDRNQTFSAFGHPASPPFTGGRLWVCTSPLVGGDPTTSPQTMAIGCDMTGGSSGGGWVVGSSVYSVNSYGYPDQPDVMYGPYQGAEAQTLFAAAQSG